MIDRLEIRNFKSIAAAALELGRVNLFIGVNGAGKSNLLEAVGLYSACLGRGIDASILSSKGVRLSAPQILKSSFKNRRDPSAIHLNGAIAGIEYSASLRSRSELLPTRVRVGIAAGERASCLFSRPQRRQNRARQE